MDVQVKLIAARLKWARENLDLTPEAMALASGVTTEEYLRLENGEADFSFTFLYKCANALDMDISELVSGSDPKLSFYNLTRAGGGMPIKREKGFDYRHVAPMLRNRKSEPFIVTAKYDEEAQHRPIPLATHRGQEFDLILNGNLRVQLGDHIYTMYPGDTVYYDSSHPHGMIAVGGSDCTFLAVVYKEGEDDPTGEPVETPVSSLEVPDDYSGLIYKKFVTETVDSRGRLTDIRIKCADNFNFGYDVVDALAAKIPSKRAMMWVGNDGEEREFTFADISKMSNKAANYFTMLGIKKGDRVMLVLKRHWQFWISIIALHKIGAVAVPATNQLVEHDFEYRFNAGEISAIVCTGDGITAEEAEKAASRCPSVKLKIMAHGKRDGWEDFDESFVRFSSTFKRVQTGKDDHSIMFFTSGTTGYPKLAMHSFTYPLGHIVTARWWHCVDPDGIHFTVADTGWGKALWGKLYGQWLCEGAVFVYDFDRFDAEKLLPLFAKYHITTFCAPPTIYRFLIRQDISRFDLSSLKHATIAGEALNPEVFNRFYEATGLKLMESFGQTETTLTIGNLFGAEPKPGSMGKPNPAYNVDIIREDGTSAPIGETGEIVIRFDENDPPMGLFQGYYKDPEATYATMNNGVYHTGDTAWRDEDGYFWYVGRVDDVIKSSGYRIGPFEIESVIMELPYVLECAITGVPDETRGQIVKATVVLTKGKEPSDELVKEIQNYVKTHTAPYKYPRKVEFAQSLPKTISGKIRRAEIRKEDNAKA
ncbi:MAG: AMP-binding protein [Clostridia bacterium]|nr:AMP-binding protein [Clostridia bacterium]